MASVVASLRRPSQAPPRSTQAQQQASQSTLRHPLPGDAVQKRDARKSRVGDKIKKRMSMRYAGTDDFLSSAPPPMPGLPGGMTSEPAGYDADADPYQGIEEEEGQSRFGQFASGDFAQSGFGSKGDEGIRRRGAADMTREEEWDLEELGKEGVDVQAFLKRALTGADEDEVKRFKAALQRSKQANAKDLQRNVFKHYAEFVSMSKEIATLENDMLELKDLLGQWKDLPQLMGMEDTLAPTLDKNGNLERRRTQRNSIADLAQMYKAQLSNLWSTVEGSQKYIPLAPGRHLVFETHNFVELNAATYKAKQSVSMFLLNDLLLIAGRRRMKSATSAGNDRDKERDRGRMVAERCWVLADLVVVDVKDSGDLTNALKIRRGKEVCVYRTSKPEDKKALLGAFRQVSQELGEKKRKESEKEQQRRKSMWQGDSGSAQPGLLSPGRPRSSIGMTVNDSKDVRWIDDYGDELTMAIAMRDWEAAVNLVEKSSDLKRIAAPNQAAVDLLTTRLNHLRPTLIAQILHDLSSYELRKAATARLVSFLTRLDSADQARDTFLATRREVMLKRVRDIKCDGDTTIYISELAIVCFTIIRHSSDWYMSAFKENKMASGFITWAKAQIETFADMFRRQVYASTIADGVAGECMRVVASHNRKLLRDVGLDFTYLLTSLLAPDPSSSRQNAPIFDISAPTPAAFHIEPSPYPAFPFPSPLPPDAEEPESPPSAGPTAPLSIPKSPRRPRPSAGSELGRSPAAGSPAPTGMGTGMRREGSGLSRERRDEEDEGSLRR